MKSPELKDRLEESEKLIQEMTVTWEEKLRKTEEIAQVCVGGQLPVGLMRYCWVCRSPGCTQSGSLKKAGCHSFSSLFTVGEMTSFVLEIGLETPGMLSKHSTTELFIFIKNSYMHTMYFDHMHFPFLPLTLLFTY